jgi:hypothetical protein
MKLPQSTAQLFDLVSFDHSMIMIGQNTPGIYLSTKVITNFEDAFFAFC